MCCAAVLVSRTAYDEVVYSMLHDRTILVFRFFDLLLNRVELVDDFRSRQLL